MKTQGISQPTMSGQPALSQMAVEYIESRGGNGGGDPKKLKDLNSRFRNYVSNQTKKSREYETMISRLGEVERDFETTMNSKNFRLRQMHETQQSYKFEQNDKISQQVNTSVAARLVCDEFYAKNRNLSADNDLLTVRKSEIDRDQNATTNKLENTAAALGACTGELNKKTVSVSGLNAELTMAKSQHNQLKLRQAKVDNQLQDTREKLERYGQETQDNIESLRTELVQRREAERRIEAELREEYQSKLDEFINQRKLSHAAEREEWLKLFRDEYHRKINAYHNANESYESKISQMRVDRSNLQDKIADLDVKINLIKCDIEKFGAESGRWVAQVGESKAKLSGLRERHARKCQDFHAMTLVKDGLVDDIRGYFQILSSEENRLGLVPRVPLQKTCPHKQFERAAGVLKGQFERGDLHADDFAAEMARLEKIRDQAV